MTKSLPRAFADVPDDFGFSEEHAISHKEAKRFLSQRCSIEKVRQVDAAGTAWDRELWSGIAELGWLGLCLDEKHGGAGLDPLHLSLLFEEMGRAAVPSPFFASWLALTLLEHAGSDAQVAELAPPLLSGERIGSVALSEPGNAFDPTRTETRATKDGKLTGTKTHVIFGSDAGLVLVPAQSDAGFGIYALELPGDGATVQAERCVDEGRPTARLVLDGARATRLERGSAEVLEHVQLFGAAMLAAEMCGGAEAVLAMTTEYAKTREQFGRPIGKFQAVKHPLVNVMVATELARSLALGAAVMLGRAPERAEAACRMAKARADDAFAFAVDRGVQLHGGIGFTRECDVHFYFKRALWSRGTLGDARHHRKRLAALLLDS